MSIKPEQEIQQNRKYINLKKPTQTRPKVHVEPGLPPSQIASPLRLMDREGPDGCVADATCCKPGPGADCSSLPFWFNLNFLLFRPEISEV